MPSLISLTDSQVFEALRSFLIAVLPLRPDDIVKAQVNRVPPPRSGDYVIMTPLLRERLSTNIDTYEDTAFTGSIAGEVLTVSSVLFGTVRVGSPVLGVGVATGTTVLAADTDGTFIVSPAQVVPSQPLFAGTASFLQPTKQTIQLDVYGPNSGDNVQRITTLFRDEVGCEIFAATGYDVQPLYTGEPRQVPFINAEQQVEARETVDVVLQANPTITLPQEFADVLSVVLVNVP